MANNADNGVFSRVATDGDGLKSDSAGSFKTNAYSQFNAMNYNSIYNASTTVQPASYQVLIIIKV